jgi:hypothetical protein
MKNRPAPHQSDSAFTVADPHLEFIGGSQCQATMRYGLLHVKERIGKNRKVGIITPDGLELSADGIVLETGSAGTVRCGST